MNEISITGSLTINKASLTNLPRGASYNGLHANMNGNVLVELAGVEVNTINTTLSVGGMASLGFGMFMNNDTINTITLVSGSDSFAQLPPGQPCGPIPLFPFMTLKAISSPSPSFGLDYVIGSL